VSDMVEGLIRAIEANNWPGSVVNLGNPDEHSVLRYAEIIRELTGKHSEIVFTEPAVGDDPQRRRPDITRARAALGWEPKVQLQEGLTRTIAYLRQELGIANGKAHGTTPATNGRIQDMADGGAFPTPVVTNPRPNAV